MHVKYMDFGGDAKIKGGAGDDTITVDSYKGKGLSLLGGDGDSSESDDVCTLEGTMLTCPGDPSISRSVENPLDSTC